MAIDFQNNSPGWEAEGTEPSSSLKSEGFKTGYKPPAAYFNWFWKRVSKCITELQEKINYVSEHGYEHPTTPGYKHIPAGGAQGQILRWSSDGTAAWGTSDSPLVSITSSNGAAYTGTVSGITTLSTGLRLTVTPNRMSTSTAPTLNINGLGAKEMRLRTGYNFGACVPASFAGWISEGKPFSVTYDGTFWVVDMTRPNAQALYGEVPVANGGTGATTADVARANLGAAKAKAAVTGTGAITVTLADYKDYSYTAVSSFNMTGAAVNAHGFITFGSSTPSVTVKGFAASSGDDITSAAASQVWEFSVYPHNGGGYIIWKNWSE